MLAYNVAGAEVAPNKSACIHGKCRCLGNPDVVQGLHQRGTHLQPLCKNISHSKDVARHCRQRHMALIVTILVPNISVLKFCILRDEMNTIYDSPKWS